MLFQNVLAYAISSRGGFWDRALLIDGHAAYQSGNAGVRTCVFVKCRFGDYANYGVELNWATHFYSFGLAIDQGPASGPDGGSGSLNAIYITGTNDGIYMEGSGIGGNILIDGPTNNAKTNNVHFSGKCLGTFTNNDPQIDGTVRASGITRLSNASPSLKCVTDSNSACLYYLSRTTSVVTGAGAIWSMVLDMKSYDVNGDYSTSTGIFTCSQAGQYQISVVVLMQSLIANNTRSDLQIYRKNSSNQIVYECMDTTNPGAQAVPAVGYATRQLSTTLNLAQGDQVSATLTVSGNSSNNVQVFGESIQNTWMSVQYIPS
jgi:hypothetical protein